MIAVGDVVKIQHRDGVSEGNVVLISRSGVGVEIDGSIWTVPANGKRAKNGARLYLPTAEELAALEVRRARVNAEQALIVACTDIKHAVRHRVDGWSDAELAEVSAAASVLLQRCGGAPW